MRMSCLPFLTIAVLALGAAPTPCRGSDSFFDSSLVLIPGGCFEMGSADGPHDERPLHRVCVDSFFIGKAEVTVWEYLECMNAGVCEPPMWWNRNFFGEEYSGVTGSEWLSMPVVGVSWDDAKRFCSWKGQSYRLPTEAEWEYAARAGSSKTYPWGTDAGEVKVFAVAEGRMRAVMSRKPNEFGVYDMIGNAWEWCEDLYGRDYYKRSEDTNPLGPEKSRKVPRRVVRGGAWNEYLWNLRTANRSYGEQYRRYGGAGFRVCRPKVAE